jgi:hypothetical protein
MLVLIPSPLGDLLLEELQLLRHRGNGFQDGWLRLGSARS